MATKRSDREAREARERLRTYTARQQVHERQTTRRRVDNLAAVAAVVVVASLAAVGQVFYFNGGPGTPTPTPTATASQNVGAVPDPSLAEGRTWTGELTLNDGIVLGVSLDGAAAPQSVASFVQSATDGYYPGKTCHRLVLGATAGLLQCGSLDGTGASDPSYAFGPIENAPSDQRYPAGTIAMARAGGDGYSNGRQFFIVFQDTTLPDDAAGGYSIVGSITSGLDALTSQIAAAGTADGSQDGAPAVPVAITALTIQ